MEEVIMSTSTSFEEKCEYINGVGHCTTIVGSRHGGPQLDTPTAAPASTAPPPSSTTSTPASTLSSPSHEPASSSSTPHLPSSTPASTGSTAAAPSNSPGTDSSPATAANGTTPYPPVTPSQGTTTSATSVSDSTTVIPNTSTSNTTTSAADSLAATASNPSASGSTFSVPFTPPSASSTHRLPAGAIAAIAISVGGLLLVLILGLLWYAARRRRRTLTVVVSSTPLGTHTTANLSETTLTFPAQRTLLPVEHESENEKLEYSPRNSLTGLDRGGSMVVQASDFGPLSRSRDRSPLSRFLETLPFLAAPPVSAKGGGGTAMSPGTATLTDATLSPSIRTRRTDPTEAPRQSAAGIEMEMETESGARRRCDLWEGDGNRDGEDWSRRGSGGFRYETDGGVCLDGGPPDEPPGPGRYVDVDDDQRTIATVVTLPPPYSRY